MQTSTPLTAQQARKIASHQGFFFGAGAGVLILLVTAFTNFLTVSSTFTEIIYFLVFLAFFLTGMRTTTKTHRIDMGARAGFWAAAVVALFLVASTVLHVYQYRATMSHSAMLSAVLAILPVGLLALLVGPTIAMLGGVLSKSGTKDVVSPSPTSAQLPSSSAPQPAAAAPLQPTQPSPPQQGQA